MQPRPEARTALSDRLFAWIFAKVPVYSILLEDPVVDLPFLDLDSRSRMLSIAGAGCGIATYVGSGAGSIDAVDSNHHHLALTALKVAASRHLDSPEQLYQLFATGRHPEAERVLRSLGPHLPPIQRAYWAKRWPVFRKGLYNGGLLHRVNSMNFGPRWPITQSFLRDIAPLPHEQRAQRLVSEVRTFAEGSPLRRVIGRSSLTRLALGMNGQQYARNLSQCQGRSMVDILLAYAERVARTDLLSNWTIWIPVFGGANPDEPGCVPPFVSEERHSVARSANTTVNYHHQSMDGFLRQNADRRWTHVNLSDIPDWLTETQQAQLLRGILPHTETGTKLVIRTVEDVDIVARAGLSSRLHLHEAESAEASRNERSCFFKRVLFYSVTQPGRVNGAHV